jgi:Zn-dependent protease
MSLDSSQLILAVLQFIPLIIAVVCHEYAHGWMAFKLGDPTAKNLGRLTLNPIRHIHWFGSVVLPALLTLAKLPVIGFAKPVPIDPNFFKKLFRDLMFVAIAGPIANFLIAAMALIAWYGLDSQFQIITQFNREISDREILNNGILLLAFGLNFTVLVNIILGLFNLIPLPPLDGSRILTFFLPQSARFFMLRIERFAFFFLLGIVFLNIVLESIFSLEISPIASLLLPVLEWVEVRLLGVSHF